MRACEFSVASRHAGVIAAVLIMATQLSGAEVSPRPSPSPQADRSSQGHDASVHATALSDAVLIVNDDAVSAREFVEALRRHRARYADPVQLRAAAYSDCLHFKVTQQLARAHGLITDISDAALRRAFAADHAQREAALARGGVIYGPKRMTWEQFRATWLDRIELELGRQLHARAGAASAANTEREAFAAALKAALAAARITRDADALAQLGPNTPLPVDMSH